MLHFSNIRQGDAPECGLVCIAIICRLLGRDVGLAELRRLHPVPASGLTLKAISDITESLGMIGVAVQCAEVEMKLLACPAILHWQLNHFVVLRSNSDGRAKIADPGSGVITMGLGKAWQKSQGVALQLTRFK